MKSEDQSNSLPGWMKGWSLERRRAFAWIAMVVTVLVLIPGLLVAGFFLFGVIQCDKHGDPNGPSVCTPIWLGIVRVLLIAIVLPPILAWSRFLGRVYGYRKDEMYKDDLYK